MLLYTPIVNIYEQVADLSINKVVPVSNIVKQEIHTYFNGGKFSTNILSLAYLTDVQVRILIANFVLNVIHSGDLFRSLYVYIKVTLLFEECGTLGHNSSGRC